MRRRLGYDALAHVHLGVYLAIALGFSHQLATGHEFVDQPVAVAYWWALYAATLAALIVFRVVLPVSRSLRHRLHVERVVPEAPGVVSLEIGGERLDRLAVRSGQYLHWRFLARGHWLHAASVLAVGGAGRPRAADHGQGARRPHRRARVAAAGHAGDRRGPERPADRGGAPAPAGGADRRRRGDRADPRAAGGHARRGGRDRGDLPRRPTPDALLFRDELDALADAAAPTLHYVVGARDGGALLVA